MNTAVENTPAAAATAAQPGAPAAKTPAETVSMVFDSLKRISNIGILGESMSTKIGSLMAITETVNPLVQNASGRKVEELIAENIVSIVNSYGLGARKNPFEALDKATTTISEAGPRDGQQKVDWRGLSEGTQGFFKGLAAKVAALADLGPVQDLLGKMKQAKEVAAAMSGFGGATNASDQFSRTAANVPKDGVGANKPPIVRS